ncbi:MULTISPECIES: hypothetical protein [unclassified Streptomyces]|nr:MULTISPECIES: hypothetical protein [unclassified Streptomyces]
MSRKRDGPTETTGADQAYRRSRPADALESETERIGSYGSE